MFATILFKIILLIDSHRCLSGPDSIVFAMFYKVPLVLFHLESFVDKIPSISGVHWGPFVDQNHSFYIVLLEWRGAQARPRAENSCTRRGGSWGCLSSVRPSVHKESQLSQENPGFLAQYPGIGSKSMIEIPNQYFRNCPSSH